MGIKRLDSSDISMLAISAINHRYDSDWQTLLDATEGYSGADLTHLATTAAFHPIRELQSARFWRFTAGGFADSVNSKS